MQSADIVFMNTPTSSPICDVTNTSRISIRRSSESVQCFSLRLRASSMTRAVELPDVASAREFYAKYEPKEIIGAGASSTVRRCVRRTSRKEYAVKIIDLIGNDELLGEDLRAVTHNEIRILRAVSGEAHIIELVDVFETETLIFLVIELLRKGELFDYLTEVVKFNEKQTRSIMRALLEAVVFLHDKSIIHRDLKPENILIDDDKNIHLSDFGFAVALENDHQKLRQLCGTPGYMSPEMLKCAINELHPGYGKEIDMWACGVIMYTLLAGLPPFYHRKEMTMFRKIMDGKYTFPSPDWDDVSESAKDVIQKLLEVDPQRRLTGKGALVHPFFQNVDNRNRFFSISFDPRHKFRVAIAAVLAGVIIGRLGQNRRKKMCQVIAQDPYSSKIIRKLIDASSFAVYGHWVKKRADQNRAMLFRNTFYLQAPLKTAIHVQ